MAIKLPLHHSHPLCKEAEQAWAKELESNSKLQQLDDETLAIFADGFIEGYTKARIKQENANLCKDEATVYLKRIASFDGHGDLYTWANDPKTAELFADIRTLLSNLLKEQA